MTPEAPFRLSPARLSSLAMPLGGAALPVDPDITFKGWAVDPQDGEINSKEGLAWASNNMDAPLGKGWGVVTKLPAGAQVITLTATDSDGNVATSSISITVE